MSEVNKTPHNAQRERERGKQNAQTHSAVNCRAPSAPQVASVIGLATVLLLLGIMLCVAIAVPGVGFVRHYYLPRAR